MSKSTNVELGNIWSQFKSIFRNELQKANTYLVFILHTVEILQFNFKKSWDLGLKKLVLPYWARISFMIY